MMAQTVSHSCLWAESTQHGCLKCYSVKITAWTRVMLSASSCLPAWVKKYNGFFSQSRAFALHCYFFHTAAAEERCQQPPQVLPPAEVSWQRCVSCISWINTADQQHPEDVQVLMRPSDSQVLIKAAHKLWFLACPKGRLEPDLNVTVVQPGSHKWTMGHRTMHTAPSHTSSPLYW